jgi:hypothetical protein
MKMLEKDEAMEKKKVDGIMHLYDGHRRTRLMALCT